MSAAGDGLSSRLRARRTALGLTQAELAERAGISERAVSDIERGLRRIVYRDTAQKLGRALQLTDQEVAEFEASARGRLDAAPQALSTAMPTVARTGLVGRTQELQLLTELFQQPDTRVVTLTGPGGVGKTRIAVEFCRTGAESFEEGVVFVALGNLRHAELVLPSIAGAMKVRTGVDAIPALATHVSGRRILLVLDTLEHLLGAAPGLAQLVERAAGIKLLVTSRAPLNIRAERLVTIAPLPEPEAVEMFLRCVRSVQPVSSAAPANHALAAEICSRLEGLPLAIELAAARTRHLAQVEIREQLDRRLQLLVGGPVDLPERQRSMAASVAWSYDLLGSDARRLLEQLSVFAGGFTLDSVRLVCDPALGDAAQLSQLVDCSLVLADLQRAGLTSYAMLDTVREYAAQRLSARSEDAVVVVETRHANRFLALAEEAAPELMAADHRDWVDRLAADWDNLRAALGWHLAAGDSLAALRIVAALWMFWRLTGAFSEGRTWMERVLAMDASGHEDVRAKALWGAGWLAYHQGDFDETARRGVELTGWARAAGDRVGVRNGLTLIGQERLAAGDYAGAARLFDEALDLARDVAAPWLLATSCLNRAVAAEHQGDRKAAHGLLAEAEALYTQLGDERFVGRVRLQLGYLALLDHDIAHARQLVSESLRTAAGLGDRWGVAEQLDGMAAVLAAAGDWRGAAAVAGAAAATWESIGIEAHPADRVSTDRWLLPVLAQHVDAAAAARDEGRQLALEHAVEFALDRARRGLSA